MKCAFFMCLLAVCFTTLLAGPASRGGKGSGCKDRRTPCADGSAPRCLDGNQPDTNGRHPSCPGGDRPVCEDGSEPQPRHLRDSGDRGSDSSSRSGRDRPRGGGPHHRDDDGSEPRIPPSRPGRGRRHGRGRDGADSSSDDGSGRDDGRNVNFAGDDDEEDDDDDACDKGKDDATIRALMIGACVGGGALTISLCFCAYCWRRAARLANARAKVHASEPAEGKTVVGCVNVQYPDAHNTVVVGQVVQSVLPDDSKVDKPVLGADKDAIHVASTADDAA